MRGDTTTENGEEADHYGESAETEHASRERRPSITTLQNMLKKVSQSPFHNQYKTLVPSNSDSSGSSANESGNKQDGELFSDLSAAATDVTYKPHLRQGLKMEDNHLFSAQNGVQEVLHVSPQNGVNSSLARNNPFYTFCVESSIKSNGTDNAGGKTSEDLSLDTIFVPPPEFQSSPLDFQQDGKSVENGAKCSEPEKDLFQTFNHDYMPDLFQTSKLAQNASANGHGQDVNLNSSDIFKTNPAHTQNHSKDVKSKGSDLFKSEVEDLFQAAKGEGAHHAAHAKVLNLFDESSIFEDPFKAPSHKENGLFQFPQCTAVNPFYSATTKETALFESDLVRPKSSSMNNRDVFSLSSTSTIDPFPSPITRDLFQDVSSLDDPFGTTPSKQHDPFQDVSNGTPDIFQTLSSNSVNSDIFKTTPSNTAFKAPYSTPSMSSLSEMNLDTLSSPVVQATSSNMPHGVVLITPHGTKHDIFQPTPFSRARNLSMSRRQSPSEMTHAQTFKRPPKPLPRTRPPRPQKPPMPEKPLVPEKPPKPASPVEREPTVPKTSPKMAFKPLPKPVVCRKPKTLEIKPVETESYVDILLTGQEKCVDDWPENSPELSPDFRPSGTLRLRRESLKAKADSDGVSGEEQDGSGSHSKKKDRKFRVSMPIRRGSKEKIPDVTKDQKSSTLPNPRRSSKENFSNMHMLAGENDDGEPYGMDYKKQPLKGKVNRLLRRSSIANGQIAQASKGDDRNTKLVAKKDSIIRRWSEGTVLDNNSTGDDEEEEEGGEAHHEEKRKKRMKIKFVPHRGFVISVGKNNEELKGAHGNTTRKGSKETSQEEVFGAHGYTPRKKSMDDPFDDEEEMKGHTPQSTSKAAFFDDDEDLKKTPHMSPGLNGDGDTFGMEDGKPKKPTKLKVLHMGRRSSKEDMLDDTSPKKVTNPKKGSFSAEELDDEELYGMEDCKQKKSKHKAPIPAPRKSKTNHESAGQTEPIEFSHCTPQHAFNDDFAEDEIAQTGKSFMSPREMYDVEQDDLEICKPKKPSKLKGLKKLKAKSKAMQFECEDPPGATCSDYLSEAAKDDFDEDEITQTGKDFMSPREMYDFEEDDLDICKPKKPSKLKGLKKLKAKSKAMQLECEDPPGATSSDYLSEAAKAEWRAAQMDERAMEGLEDSDEDGDTDSLMEWWYTVEKWDEVPSDDEEKVIQEDESKSFTILADKVDRGLRVFNKVFTERAEVLWHSVITLHAIADDISNFHHKAKIAGITGGTTTAVGGVTAIAGLALAPFTFGASLVVTAVGVGVATAGGITSASAAISDNVNNMHDRKKVETVLQEYEDHLLDIAKILHFVNHGLYKLRGHPFLRSGTQHYSEEWEVRRAVQMISLVDSPVMRATEITDAAVASVQGLFKGMDKYFIKDSRELKKGCKKEIVSQIKEVANVLNDGIVELNSIREELRDSTGNM